MRTFTPQDAADGSTVKAEPPGKLLHPGTRLMRRHELSDLVPVEALLSLLG